MWSIFEQEFNKKLNGSNFELTQDPSRRYKLVVHIPNQLREVLKKRYIVWIVITSEISV